MPTHALTKHLSKIQELEWTREGIRYTKSVYHAALTYPSDVCGPHRTKICPAFCHRVLCLPKGTNLHVKIQKPTTLQINTKFSFKMKIITTNLIQGRSIGMYRINWALNRKHFLMPCKSYYIPLISITMVRWMPIAESAIVYIDIHFVVDHSYLPQRDAFFKPVWIYQGERKSIRWTSLAFCHRFMERKKLWEGRFVSSYLQSCILILAENEVY